MKTTHKLGLTLTAILGLAAGCATTSQPQRAQFTPTPIVQEARVEDKTPCDLSREVDSYVGYKVMGGFPHSTFFAQAVGIENRRIEVVKEVNRDGEVRYTSQGTMPAPYSVLMGPSKNKALRHLRNADIADGKEDHCITPEGIEVVMDAVRERYAVTESKPVHIEMIDESYSRTGSNGSGSYRRSEVREGNKKPRVEETHTGNLSVDEIVGGPSEVYQAGEVSKPVTSRFPKHGGLGTCNWNHNSALRSCKWDKGSDGRSCRSDARFDGKSENWVQRCLGKVQASYKACVGNADDAYHKCREE